MDTAARLLRLLSLLQARPTWSGTELAGRLGVTTRTVRRDVTRLRDLGYPVDAAPGVEGGYRLGAGGRLPPLLLDDDEAVAIAVGLRLASTTAVSGVEASAVAALAKLDQVLPTHLRERVGDLQASTVELQGAQQPSVDVEVLVTLATGCRRSEGLRFSYRTHGGDEGERSVEPHRIVHTGRRWYLVARDRDRQAWRTFRIDRITGPVLTGHRYVIDDPPDAAALVSEGTTIAPWGIRAVLRLHLDVEEARRRFPPTVGVVEAAGPDRSTLTIAADTRGGLVAFAAGLGCDFDVLEPAELRDALRRHGRRLARRHASPPAAP
jgi:predicted DNA-binding transcriptional regulator YafY